MKLVFRFLKFVYLFTFSEFKVSKKFGANVLLLSMEFPTSIMEHFKVPFQLEIGSQRTKIFGNK